MACDKCIYYEEDIYTIAGHCTYFKTIGKEKKEIPLDISSKGCKFYKSKNHPLFDYAMEVFNGIEIK
tara:strand:- start:4746 stop:4946 length:201 start_codon:yes stop_codon:yes gene_type:complete